MKPARIAVVLAVLFALGALSLSAQPVISAKSGVIAYVEGKVFLGDQAVEYSVTKFPDMKENQVVRTEEGRAEVLLTPGVVLRLGENSSLKLLTNRLIDTRLELLSGSAVVEADDIAKDTAVSIVCKNGTAALSKAGIYRFDGNPGSVKVFKGLANVEMAGSTTPVGAGRMLTLDGTSASVQKFDAEQTDALDHWSHRRGEYLALANVSAAKSLIDSGTYSPATGWGLGSLAYGLGATNCMSAWAFNQWYDMYTYMPCRGYMYSPYGYRFWSPFTVAGAYYGGWGYGYGYGRNGYGYNGGGGNYGAVGGSSAGPSPRTSYSAAMSSAGASRSGVSGTGSAMGGSGIGGHSAGGGGVSSGGGGASSGGGGGGHAGGGGHR